MNPLAHIREAIWVARTLARIAAWAASMTFEENAGDWVDNDDEAV